MGAGDRKSKRASSSARAASQIAQTGGNTVLGSGFGGYSGSRPVYQSQGSDQNEAPGSTVLLDADVQQFLKHLLKRAPATKLKALQGLAQLVQDRDAPALVIALPHWIYAYKRLVMDVNRTVRSKANEVLQSFVAKLKRELAPHLKSVIGPWWLGQHDIYTESAQIAQSAFQVAFSESKRDGAVLYCMDELLKYLSGNLLSEAKKLGDPSKEDRDELEVRYECVMCASLSGMQHLLQIAKKLDSKEESTAVCGTMSDLLSTKSFLKKHLAASSPLIRQHAYRFIECVSLNAPDALNEHLNVIAPFVIGSIGEKEASCHSSMWSMVLRFVTVFPESWTHSNFNKAILPRLCAFLRHGAYGSPSESYAAVLPFISQIPDNFWGKNPEILVKVMEATLEGVRDQPTNRAVAKASQNLLKDCIVWGMLSAQKLSDTPADFQNAFLERGLTDNLLKGTFDRSHQNWEVAEEAICQSVHELMSLAKESVDTPAGSALSVLLDHLSIEMTTSLTTHSTPSEDKQILQEGLQVCSTVTDVACKLKPDSENEWGMQLILSKTVQPIGGILVRSAVAHDAEIVDIQALVRLVQTYGPDATQFTDSQDETTNQVQKMFQSVLSVCLTYTVDSEAANGYAQLIIGCLNGTDQVDQKNHWTTILKILMDGAGDGSTESKQKCLEFAALLIGNLLKQDTGVIEGFRCDALFLLAKQCAQSDMLQSTPSCIAILKMLITGHHQLLPESSIHTVYSQLLSVLNDNMDSGAGKGVLQCLAGVLFNGGVPGYDKGLEEWCNLVCEIAEIAFEDPDDAHSRVVYDAACEVWEEGVPLQALYRTVPSQVHKVISTLEGSVINLITSPTLTTDAAKRAAHRTAKLVKLWTAPPDRFKSLNQILLSNSGWPRWCTAQSGVTDTASCTEFNALSAKMVAFCTELMENLGLGMVLGGDHSDHSDHVDLRGWLVIEMLCEGQYGNIAPGLSEKIVDHLVVSIVASVSEHGEVHENESEIASILDTCLHGALHGHNKSVFLTILHSLLDGLVEHEAESGVLQLLEEFFSVNLTSLTPDSEFSQPKAHLLLEILPLLSTPLRLASEEHVRVSGLAQLSCNWLEAAEKLPPLLTGSCKEADVTLRVLEVALACFPVNPTMNFDATKNDQPYVNISQHEERKLLDLIKRQLLQVTEESDVPSRIQYLVSALALRAIAYCHDLLEQSDWHALLTRMHANLQRTTVCLEECVESVVETLVEIAQGFAQVQSPTMAIQLVSRIASKGLLKGTDMEKCISSLPISTDLHSFLSASNWARGLILMLNFDSEGSTHYSQHKWKCEDAVQQCLKTATRSVLCGAAVSCVVQTSGGGALDVLLNSMEKNKDFWESLACLVDEAFNNGDVVSKALEGMDVWAEETGVEALRCALALALTPHSFGHSFDTLQKVGVKLVASEPVIWQMSPKEPVSEEELEKWRDDNGTQGVDECAYLIQSGVHPSLAPHLVSPTPLHHFLLSWALILMHLFELPDNSPHRQSLTAALRLPPTLVPNLLNKLTPLLPLPSTQANRKSVISSAVTLLSDRKGGSKVRDLTLREFVRERGVPVGNEDWGVFVEKMYSALLVVLPASCRMWFADLRDRSLMGGVEAYTALAESPSLIQREFACVKASSGSPSDSFHTRCVPSRNEVIAVMDVEDGSTLELVIKLPSCLPLKPPEAECHNSVGVSENQLRKWILSICAFLRYQNGSVVEAVALWKKNLDKEFQGIEPCLICYSVIHPSTRQLPKLKCVTCHVQFHAACLYRWFRQSGKSQCPHCQAPWSAGRSVSSSGEGV